MIGETAKVEYAPGRQITARVGAASCSTTLLAR